MLNNKFKRKILESVIYIAIISIIMAVGMFLYLQFFPGFPAGGNKS